MSDRPPFADAASSTTLYSDEFDRLIADGSGPVATTDSPKRIDGAVVGTLVALTENGGLPLVIYKGQPGTAALCAQTTIDLHAAHIGRQAVLMFEAGDPCRPIVIGCLREFAGTPVADLPDNVEIQADGERLIVSANDQLVLRCGKASITLTRAGKIIIEGAYVSSRSSGVLRLRGGSVQIN